MKNLKHSGRIEVKQGQQAIAAAAAAPTAPSGKLPVNTMGSTRTPSSWSFPMAILMSNFSDRRCKGTARRKPPMKLADTLD
jgi:hypothetical protein